MPQRDIGLILMRQLADGLAVPMLLADERGDLLFFNEPAERLLGQRFDDVQRMLGAYRSVRGGHKLNHAVLTALLADRTAWRVIEAETARRSRVYAEAGSGMVGGMIAPAYGPDVS